VIKYLYEVVNVKLTQEVIILAFNCKHINIVKYFAHIGIEFTQETINYISEYNNLKLVHYLLAIANIKK
jgi:hypothetical protein